MGSAQLLINDGKQFPLGSDCITIVVSLKFIYHWLGSAQLQINDKVYSYLVLTVIKCSDITLHNDCL